MTSQSREQSIAIHVLLNISRSKGNQAMKFGPLIEYHVRNIFLENSYTERVGETIPIHFFKKSNLYICLGQKSKVLYSLLLFYVKLGTIKAY